MPPADACEASAAEGVEEEDDVESELNDCDVPSTSSGCLREDVSASVSVALRVMSSKKRTGDFVSSESRATPLPCPSGSDESRESVSDDGMPSWSESLVADADNAFSFSSLSSPSSPLSLSSLITLLSSSLFLRTNRLRRLGFTFCKKRKRIMLRITSIVLALR